MKIPQRRREFAFLYSCGSHKRILRVKHVHILSVHEGESHHNLPKAALGNDDFVRIDLNGDVLQPGDRRTTTILILSFHAKEGQAGSWPTLPGKQVGAGPLEMEKEAIKGMVVRVSKDHTGAALH